MDIKPSDWTVDYFVENKSHCLKIIEDEEQLNRIPSINSVALDHFKNGQLVRFEGMIQDMYNPELYVEQYVVVDQQTGVTNTRNGMYIDIAHCEPNESFSLQSKDVRNGERQILVLISTPGLNEWAKEKVTVPISKEEHLENRRSIKRSIDDCDEQMDCSEPDNKKEKANSDVTASTSQSMVVSKEHILNFPIPINDGRSCIVKVYDEVPFKLNQVVEVIGFLSVDPLLSKYNEPQEGESDIEKQTCHPPASLVPRLHAVKMSTPRINFASMNPTILNRAESIRCDLKMVLSQLLFGDEIAADYLICHLISAVYLRKDTLCLGNFPLNITNFPSEYGNTFPKDTYEILEQLIQKSHFLRLSLDTLNDESLIPKKDYDCNRLTSGILQLSDNTHLIIDETSLTPGQISALGKKNYAAIAQVLSFQTLAYDFNFYPVEYETDIPMLIFSHVKSFLPCPMRVVLKPDPETMKMYPQVREAAKQYLKDTSRLNDIRQYLHELKSTSFDISDDISKIIQQDFVTIRQADKEFFAENLHSLMVLARLMSLSYGLKTLTEDMWKKSVAMELERLDRLPKRNKS